MSAATLPSATLHKKNCTRNARNLLPAPTQKEKNLGNQSVVGQGKDVQISRLTDEVIDDARKMIGVWLRRDVHWPTIAEPISLHDIRRWALYSVGDDNPLWMDASHGKLSIWGNNIAPPTFLYSIDSGIVA